MTENDKRPVMLSLISEQASPNVMAALLVEPRPSTMVCLLPEDREHEGQVDREFETVFQGIYAALSRVDPSIRVINWVAEGSGRPVSPYDADQVRRACQAIGRDPRFAGDDWVYNVTGGTKVMAQAALDDARENGHRALYVDTESRHLIWDGEGAVPFTEGHLGDVGVAEYLTAYGIEVKRYQAELADDLGRAARLLGQNYAGPSLAEKIMGDQSPPKDDEVIRRFDLDALTPPERDLLFEIVRALSQRDLELRETDGGLELHLWTTDEELRSFFWGGRWLESYTFETICRLHRAGGEWRYNLPWRNVLLEWSGIQFSGLLEPITDDLVRPANELDVAATRGARLLVCECKTGKNALDPKHLYKLQVIGHKLGTFADKVLITDRQHLLDPENRGTRHRVVRALTLNIAVVEASQLPALEQILAEPEKELRKQKRLLLRL